jgi:hypothetical protein
LTNIAQGKRLSAVGLRLNASRMRRKEKAALMAEQDAPTIVSTAWASDSKWKKCRARRLFRLV